VHRIGRTGRAGRTGVAVTLVDWDELARWTTIDKALNLGCPDPAETYSSSPHLYTELEIPTGARGSVGKPRKSSAKRPARDAGTDGPRARRDSGRSRRRTRGGKPVSGPRPNGEAAKPSPLNSEAASGENGHGGPRRRRRPRKAAAGAANPS
jgi:superfamily II DNA/RNA helicase